MLVYPLPCPRSGRDRRKLAKCGPSEVGGEEPERGKEQLTNCFAHPSHFHAFWVRKSSTRNQRQKNL